MKYIVFLGVIISLIGTVSYVKEMLNGKVKPNRVSWLLWSIAPIIATIAALTDGVTLSVIPVFMSGFGPLIIFILSFLKKEAYWKITRSDLGCGALSLIALIIWYITKDPATAIIFAIASDFLAAIPTVIKSIKYPETETSSAFIAGLLNASTSFAAISKWNFVSLAFPIYLVIINIVIIGSIEKDRIFNKKIK